MIGSGTTGARKLVRSPESISTYYHEQNVYVGPSAGTHERCVRYTVYTDQQRIRAGSSSRARSMM